MKVSGWRLDVSKSSRVTHVHLSAPTEVDYLGRGISVRITRENWRGRPASAPPRKDLVREFSHLPWAEFDTDVDVLLHPGEALRLETTAPGVCCEWTVDATQPTPEPAVTEPSSTYTFLQALAAAATDPASPRAEMARRGRVLLGVDPAVRRQEEQEQQLAQRLEQLVARQRDAEQRLERLVKQLETEKKRQLEAEKQQPKPTRKIRLK